MGCYVELLRACKDGNSKKVKKLLTTCKDIADVRDLSDRTLLHYCYQYETCAEMILEVAPELLNIGEKSGYTVLHLSAMQAHSELVLRYILSKNPDINKRTNDLRTPLLLAVIASNCEAVRILCEAKAEVNVLDNLGVSPLHYICKTKSTGDDSNRHIEIIDILLEHGADIDILDSIERSPLIYTVSSSNEAKMRHLLSKNANINTRDVSKLSILHYAVSAGDLSIIKILLSELKYDIESLDTNKCTSLMYACTMGRIDIVSALIDLSANIKAEDSKKRNSVHFVCSKGDLEILRILAGNNGNLWQSDEDGNLPLHEASFNGHEEIVDYFLSHNNSQEKMSDYINRRNINGLTPFHLAVYRNHVKTCRILLEHGADPNIPVKARCGTLITPLDLCQEESIKHLIRQFHGKTAAEMFMMGPILEDGEESIFDEDTLIDYHCCEHNHDEMVHGVIDSQEDKNDKDEDSISEVTETLRNFILESCYQGDLDTIKSMVDRGVCLSDIVDDSGKNCLHYSIHSLETLTFIIDLAPDCLIRPDYSGVTVLNLAIMSHDNDHLSLLLERGSDVNVPDHSGRTCLHIAVKYKNIECLRIINRMMSDKSRLCHKADNKGKFPIHNAVELFKRCNCSTLSREFIEILLSMNADIECRDAIQRTPLMLAVNLNNIDAVEVLLDHGADITARDDSGLCSIHYGCVEGHFDIVCVLSKAHNYDPNIEDDHGLTPIFYAVSNCHDRIVQYLIDHGVRLDVVDQRGRNLCHEAAEKGASKCLQLMLSQNVDRWRQSNNGTTPLHEASQHGHTEIAEMILTEENAREYANIKNEHHQTALHLAALRNDVHMCGILVKQGCNINELAFDEVTEIKSTAYDLSTSEHCRETLFALGGRSGKRRLNSIIIEENGNIAMLTDLYKGNQFSDADHPVPIDLPTLPHFIISCSRNNSRKSSLTTQTEETPCNDILSSKDKVRTSREKHKSMKVDIVKKGGSVKSSDSKSDSRKSSMKKSTNSVHNTRNKTQTIEGKVHSSILSYEFVRLNSKKTCDCVRMQIRRQYLERLRTSNIFR